MRPYDAALYDAWTRDVGIIASFTIQDVPKTFIGAAATPRFAVQASSVAFTLQDLLQLAQIGCQSHAPERWGVALDAPSKSYFIAASFSPAEMQQRLRAAANSNRRAVLIEVGRRASTPRSGTLVDKHGQG